MNENEGLKEVQRRYGCGPVQFHGTDDALYDRHLIFDSVIEPEEAALRDQFEAVARSLRDVFSQRWLLTEKTYQRKNPKRVYYLSMEFLLGRSLANNIMNLRLDHEVRREAVHDGRFRADPCREIGDLRGLEPRRPIGVGDLRGEGRGSPLEVGRLRAGRGDAVAVAW